MTRTALPGDEVAFTLLDALPSTAYRIALRRLSTNTLIVAATTTGVVEQDPGGPTSNYTGTLTVPADAPADTYQGEFSFGSDVYPDDELLEVLVGPQLTGDTVIQSLVDHKPPERHDEVAWTQARVEYSVGFDGPWFALQTLDLEADEDPSLPALRSWTVQVDSGALWLRPVWIDDDGLEQAGVVVSAGQVPYLPTADQISAELQAYATDRSGNNIGVFDSDTDEDEAKLQRVIIAAVRDVSSQVGSWIPGPVIADARRVTALDCAAIAVRSMLPEQSGDDRSDYQALSAQYESALKELQGNMTTWRMAYRGGFA